MGAYSSRFQQGKTALDTKTYSRAYEAEWIVEHARVTGLSIVKVERLWLRFQQLGCNTSGTLHMDALPAKIRNDKLVTMVLSSLKDGDGNIRFLTFANFLSWLESADTTTRVKAVYQLLSNGKNLNKDEMFSLMKLTFPTETEASVFKLTDILMRNMDDRQQGYVNEDQFVQYLRRIPDARLNKILAFSIIPEYIDMRADIVQGQGAADTYRPVSSSEHSRQIPTDFILMEVAEKACRRDWYMLGNLLDITSNSLSDFDSKHTEPREKVFAMLKAWRDREAKKAHLIRLERALRQSGMNDIAMLLQP